MENDNVPVKVNIFFEGVWQKVEAKRNDFVFQLMHPFRDECLKIGTDLKNMEMSHRGQIVREDMTLNDLGVKNKDYFMMKRASPATDERTITNYGIIARPIYFWVNLQSHICRGNHIILSHLCSLILSPQNPLRDKLPALFRLLTDQRAIRLARIAFGSKEVTLDVMRLAASVFSNLLLDSEHFRNARAAMIELTTPGFQRLSNAGLLSGLQSIDFGEPAIKFAWPKHGRNAGNRPIKGLGWEPSSHYLGDSDHLAGKLLLLVQSGIDQMPSKNRRMADLFYERPNVIWHFRELEGLLPCLLLDELEREAYKLVRGEFWPSDDIMKTMLYDMPFEKFQLRLPIETPIISYLHFIIDCEEHPIINGVHLIQLEELGFLDIEENMEILISAKNDLDEAIRIWSSRR